MLTRAVLKELVTASGEWSDDRHRVEYRAEQDLTLKFRLERLSDD